MFNKFFRQIKLRIQRAKKHLTGKSVLSSQSRQTFSTSLETNLQQIRLVFSDCSDITVREFSIGHDQQVKAFVVFVDGLVDMSLLQQNLLKPLMFESHLNPARQRTNPGNILKLIENSTLTMAHLKEVQSMEQAVQGILSGEAAVFVDGYHVAILAGARGWESRGVEEPDTEVVVRGPREGFVETLSINTSLLRRKIKNSNLKIEKLTIGQQTHTDVAIVYLKGVVNNKMVEEVKRRLKSIDTDSILESGYIEAFIEDAPFSPFATVGNSEKPDPVAAKLLEGRVAILVDGTPFVLTVPYLFIESFQVSEDYYSRPYYSTLIRWIRFLAYFLTVATPGVYVALSTHNQEVIPTPLLLTMAAAREGTPFPAILEALGMGAIYEILREAGVRLPRPVGQAVSIVGALVIGESAVGAGIIGAPMVIVIALTAIAGFVIPSQSDSTAIVRLLLVILAGILGQYGLILGISGLLVHLCTLRSFGVPYLSPLAPLTTGDLKDVLVRVPLWAMFQRPRLIGRKSRVRQKFSLMPKILDTEKDRATTETKGGK
ncbi:MAG: spore germination protein [Dehalobacterium sp.]